MRRLLISLGLLASMVVAGSATGQEAVEQFPAPAQPACGSRPIAIARMQWPSAALLAEIHARILKAQFGCDVRVVTGDLAATASSMGTTGQPAVAPEMWIARIADIWNPAVKAQQVRSAAQAYTESIFEGWFVTDDVAASNPKLLTAGSLREHWQVFADGARARFVSCPPDWACAVINRNLLKAHGLDQYFDVVEPANRFELDTLIAQAVSRKEPIVFYYWQPNPVLAQFRFKSLDMGSYNKDAFLCLGRLSCAAPQPSGFPPEPVVVALAEWVFTEASVVAAYFERAQMPLGEMNAMLQQLNETGATIEAVADQFVAERGSLWRAWAQVPGLMPITR